MRFADAYEPLLRLIKNVVDVGVRAQPKEKKEKTE
jgi:hypothetical protein